MYKLYYILKIIFLYRYDLQTDLSKVDRKRTPWLLVIFHVPWYNSNTAHQGEGSDMMKTMEPLLYAAKVDLAFAGHVHAYERSVCLLCKFYLPIIIEIRLILA